MTKLYLHIGHPKTGSSALQVSFARSMQTLRKWEIYYPEHRSTRMAQSGMFTAGNLNRVKLFESYYEHCAEFPDAKAIFYSCEGLFDDLDQPESQVLRLAEAGVEIKLLMFLRNPVEFALSFYQQKVKSAGYVGSVDDYLSTFDHLDQVGRVLDLTTRHGIDLTLYSFDRNKKTLLELAEKWLGLPTGTLEQPERAPTNRSVTRAEQAFLSSLSAHLGPSGTDHIGKNLTNQLPSVPKELPALSRKAYEGFVTRIAPKVDELNTVLSPELQYQVTPYEHLYEHEPAQGHFEFSKEQIDVITQALASRAPTEEFAREFIRWVKGLTAGATLSDEDILRLNIMGQILRPGNFPAKRMTRLEKLAKKTPT